MSRSASVTLLFGGEERLFRLGIKQLEAIDEKCDAGPMELIRRYVQGTWKVHDLREVIIQGLLGAGAAQAEASSVIRRYFDDLPMGQFVPIAQAIVSAAVVGVEDDEPGEEQAGEVMTQTLSRETASGSPDSTASAP